MVAVLYSDILREAGRTGKKYGDVELRDWFRDKALQLSSRDLQPTTIISEAKKTSEARRFTPGKMFFYNYDPKHKKTLPYYDTFPMIFGLEKYSDGWLGVNCHYLPPVYRARLMDALYDTINNQRYDDTTKLQINYKIMKAAAKMSYFKPCIKRYLTSHVKSRIIEINPKEWDYCLMLPVARFQKAQQRTVWDESIKQIMSGKR